MQRTHTIRFFGLRALRAAAITTLTAIAALTPNAATAQDVVIGRRPHRPQHQPIECGPVAIRVSIHDDVATTELRQVLRNKGNRPAEADWILPLPPGASADGFSMTADGKTLEGEVLDQPKARKIYEDIVRRMKDPGLLEYFGSGCLRSRVFPIPPNGEVEVKVRYRHLLPATGAHRTWTFPLRALAGVGGNVPIVRGGRLAPERVSLDLSIELSGGLRNAFSPTPGMDVIRKNDRVARASFEIEGDLPEHDPVVIYGRSDDVFGLDVVAHRTQGADEGHFLLLLQPRLEGKDREKAETIDKVVQFVLDTSGSMKGEKIEQARRALLSFVDSLAPNDQFNIVPFSTEARPMFEHTVQATDENKAKAREMIAAITARGGTNIGEALDFALRATADNECLKGKAGPPMPIVVFLTDGLPTIGETDSTVILKNIRSAQTAADDDLGKRRVFCFGVGDDVDTRLLDTIAVESGGERDYVAPGADIELSTEALLDKIGEPVLFDCELAIEGVEVMDMHPRQIPDLFRGSHIVVAGRFKKPGTGQRPGVVVRLSGRDRDGKKQYVFEPRVQARQDETAFVRTIWAQRRVGFLLDEIRLKGNNQELVDEVERLGREYGIVTPFTSHLIVEESARLARARGVVAPGRSAGDAGDAGDDAFGFFAQRDGDAPDAEAAEELRQVYDRLESARQRLDEVTATTPSADPAAGGPATGSPSAPATGRSAVTNSLEVRELKKGRASESGAKALARKVGSRSFHLVRGVWVDKAYTAAMKGKEKKISAFSPEWFELLRSHPTLGPVLALSTRLVVVVDGQAHEITPAE